MAITNPTATLIFDTRRSLNDSNKYPVKLNIYYLGEKKRYGLPYSFTKEEWTKLKSPKLKDDRLKEALVKLNFYTGEKFKDTLKKIEEPFTFEKFEELYFSENHISKQNFDVYSAYQKYIDKLNQKDKVGNAQIYTSAMKTFKVVKKKLVFNEIDFEFLQSYEKQMLKNNRSISYIAMNLRTLRSIYNQAISQGIVKQENYPFSTKRNDKKYQIKKGNNTKKALSTDQLKILINYEAKTPAQQKALDMWLFSFYCNGMNMKDICRLKYKNISNNYIIFNRAKTENSTLSSQQIRFKVINEIKSIISKYGNVSISPEIFIFNVLNHGITAKVEMGKIQSFIRNINKHMKVISQELGFDTPVSTYWARHSFATYLKREGSSIEVISEALGHSSVTTTRNYLDSFMDDTLENTGNLLSSIK